MSNAIVQTPTYFHIQTCRGGQLSMEIFDIRPKWWVYQRLYRVGRVWGYTCITQDMPVCPSMYSYIIVYARISECILWYTGIPRYALGCTCIYPDVVVYTFSYAYIRICWLASDVLCWSSSAPRACPGVACRASTWNSHLLVNMCTPEPWNPIRHHCKTQKNYLCGQVARLKPLEQKTNPSGNSISKECRRRSPPITGKAGHVLLSVFLVVVFWLTFSL